METKMREIKKVSHLKTPGFIFWLHKVMQYAASTTFNLHFGLFKCKLHIFAMDKIYFFFFFL